jgi:hypothetical protein
LAAYADSIYPAHIDFIFFDHLPEAFPDRTPPIVRVLLRPARTRIICIIAGGSRGFGGAVIVKQCGFTPGSPYIDAEQQRFYTIIPFNKT